MRVVKAQDGEAAIARLALHVYEFFWRDAVSGPGRLAANIRAAYDLADQVVRAGDMAEQNPAALIGISEFAMRANRVEIVLRQYQHRR